MSFLPDYLGFWAPENWKKRFFLRKLLHVFFVSYSIYYDSFDAGWHEQISAVDGEYVGLEHVVHERDEAVCTPLDQSGLAEWTILVDALELPPERMKGNI